MTISLQEQRHQALKETAARTGKTMTQIIDEALAGYGLKSAASALDLVNMARRNSNLSEDEAMAFALAEVKEYRRSIHR